MSEQSQGHPETTMITGTLHIPVDVQQRGAAFLHQQFWCWGYDIRHAEGNLLRRYGFTCQRPPDQVTGSSFYLLHQPEGKIIALWGFGLWYAQADVGSFFLRRYSFAPCLAAMIEPPCIWTPTHLPRLSLPSTQQEGYITQSLFSALLQWISSYEQWVQQIRGCGYREQCLKDWDQTIIAAEDIAMTWQHLADLCRDWPCTVAHEAPLLDTHIPRSNEKEV
jgi:hypothetical protein